MLGRIHKDGRPPRKFTLLLHLFNTFPLFHAAKIYKISQK